MQIVKYVLYAKQKWQVLLMLYLKEPLGSSKPWLEDNAQMGDNNLHF